MSVFTVLQDIVNTFIIDSRTTVEIENPETIIIHSKKFTNDTSMFITVGSSINTVKMKNNILSKEVSKQKAIDILQRELSNK